jgi:hypothetical protein
MRVFVRNEPVEQLLGKLKEYDSMIDEIPSKLDWIIEDYWNDPETEIRKVCEFVNMSYNESLNKFNSTLVRK